MLHRNVLAQKVRYKVLVTPYRETWYHHPRQETIMATSREQLEERVAKRTAQLAANSRVTEVQVVGDPYQEDILFLTGDEMAGPTGA